MIIIIKIVFEISWETYSLSYLHKRNTIQKVLEIFFPNFNILIQYIHYII